MNIALIGYGKMGKEIEKILIERGHQVSLKVTKENADFSAQDLKTSDVAIEFSTPGAAKQNIITCLNANIPVVVGTTGEWYDSFEELKALSESQKTSLFYATNFSVGVNIFFKLNKILAKLMNSHKEYDISMEEIHHTEKKDAPSGTAITLAEGLIEETQLTNWINEEKSTSPEVLPILSKRISGVPGTHTVKYSSDIDDIEITHTAHNRKGFATGAVLAAEFISDKTGMYNMNDLLKI